MIAVDTNILVYAHREDSPWHEMALDRVTALANSGAPWAIPWPGIHEFLAIVTHPKIYHPPTPLAIALESLRAWQASPGLTQVPQFEAKTGKKNRLEGHRNLINTWGRVA